MYWGFAYNILCNFDITALIYFNVCIVKLDLKLSLLSVINWSVDLEHFKVVTNEAFN